MNKVELIKQQIQELDPTELRQLREWFAEFDADEVTYERSAEPKVLTRRRLSDLYGSLPATRPLPGEEEIREEVGRELGKTLRGIIGFESEDDSLDYQI